MGNMEIVVVPVSDTVVSFDPLTKYAYEPLRDKILEILGKNEDETTSVKACVLYRVVLPNGQMSDYREVCTPYTLKYRVQKKNQVLVIELLAGKPLNIILITEKGDINIEWLFLKRVTDNKNIFYEQTGIRATGPTVVVPYIALLIQPAEQPGHFNLRSNRRTIKPEKTG